MSYNASTGAISAPVSIDDVKSALGESSNDIATLCKSANINMWAKYKPTSYPAPFPSDWYKAADGNYGISFTTYSNLAAVVAAYYIAGDEQTHNNGYSYKRPSGGATSPYRLGDFRGYRHTAEKGVVSFSVPSEIAQGNYVGGSCIATIKKANSDYIALGDVGSFENCYFGIALLNSDKSIAYFQTSDSKIGGQTAEGAGGLSCRLGTADKKVGLGNYIAIPFLCTASHSLNETFKAASWYALPNVKPLTIKVVTVASTIKLTCSMVWTNNNPTGVKLLNEGTTTIDRISVEIRFSDSDNNATLIQGEASLMNDGSLAVGASTTLNYQRYRLLDKSQKIVVKVGGILKWSQVIPMQSQN